MRRIPSLAFLLILGAGLQDPAGDALPFEGALVVETPLVPEGLVPGDVLLSLNGQTPTRLALLRRQLAESVNSVVKGQVKRQGKDVSLEWTPPPGTYRLLDWPDPVELFRRTHPSELEKPAVQAGLGALQAAVEGKARTAVRLLERCREAGLQDPLLDWAEATVKIRYQNAPTAGDVPLGRALKAVETPSNAGQRRLRGLCLIVVSYNALLHQHSAEQALRQYEASRATGIDVADLGRAVAAALPPNSKDLWALRVRGFEDDPLDRSTAEWLAAHASTPEENALYADWVRRLSGQKRADPLLELAGLVARLKSDPKVRRILQAFLAEHPGLAPEDRARGLDGLARSFELNDEAEPAFDLRLEALTTSPSVARATSAARVARSLGRFAPVLRFLRSLDNPNTNETSKRAFLSIYTSLSATELAAEGAPVIQEAVRLERLGRPDEAAGLLMEKAEAFAQPELRVTAGLVLRHAGAAVDPKVYFEDELEFWNHRMWDETDDGWRYALLASRLGPEGASSVDNRIDRGLGGRPAAVTSALKAALAWNLKQPGKAEEYLRNAAALVGKEPSGSGWMPLYAEGRYCRSPGDWIAALVAGFGFKIELPRSESLPAPARAGPVAATPEDGVVRPLAQLLEESERIVAGTVEPSTDRKQFFHFRCIRALKGTLAAPVLTVNASSAQAWHPQAIAAAVVPGTPAMVFTNRDKASFLYAGRLFVRIEGDPRLEGGGPWWGASRIELNMNRTFDGTADELADRVQEALADRTRMPVPNLSLPPLRPEALGVPVTELALLWVPFVPEGEGFLQHWLVLGPIELNEKASDHTAASQKEFFDKEWFPGQANARPRPGIAPPLERGTPEWGEKETTDFAIDLGTVPNCLWLGVAYVFCEKDLPGVVLSIGSDDSSKWTLNGQEVIRVYAGRGVGRDQNRSGPVTLQQGLNVLTFEVINGAGGCGASARFVDSAGQPVRDFVYGLNPSR